MLVLFKRKYKGTRNTLKMKSVSTYTPVYHETGYPFIPAIREEYDQNRNTTSSSLASLVNLITELEIQRETWTKESPFFGVCENVNAEGNELPMERSLETTLNNGGNVIRNSCRFQQTRTGKYGEFYVLNIPFVVGVNRVKVQSNYVNSLSQKAISYGTEKEQGNTQRTIIL